MNARATRIFRTVSLIVVGLAAAGLEADGKPAFSWPGGARAAVSLAYDDGLDSHLDIALPALNRYGFKGSFYLTLSSTAVRDRLEEWRAAAGQGHELGNHTVFHPCSASKPGREWVQPHRDLDRMNAAEVLEEIRLASTMLHAIDGRTERTFTVPCGDLEAAGENYVEQIKSDFVAIKAYAGGVAIDMDSLDPHAVGVFTPLETSGEQLIAVVRQAAENGTVANITFHGVGGDHLPVSRDAHEQLLQYLADNEDIYWVDTFLTIMKHVRANASH
jgi:peptidoglycan/xylan/chitin deacetylase (PgdA/CDA1 family)